MQVQHSISQGNAASIEEGVKLAESLIDSGAALEETGRICGRDK